jgi:hypothetical protein
MKNETSAANGELRRGARKAIRMFSAEEMQMTIKAASAANGELRRGARKAIRMFSAEEMQMTIKAARECIELRWQPLVDGTLSISEVPGCQLCEVARVIRNSTLKAEGRTLTCHYCAYFVTTERACASVEHPYTQWRFGEAPASAVLDDLIRFESVLLYELNQSKIRALKKKLAK